MIQQLLTIEFPDYARRWTTVVFFWSGYAVWIGLLVQTVFRSRDFSRPWQSFCLGWVGVALGPLIVGPFLKNGSFDPVSPSGIGVALAFSIVAFIAYHVISFLFFKRDEEYDDYEHSRDPYDGMSQEELANELRLRDRERGRYDDYDLRERGALRRRR